MTRAVSFPPKRRRVLKAVGLTAAVACLLTACGALYIVLEPIRARIMIRRVHGWVESIRHPPSPRAAKVADYQPVVLPTTEVLSAVPRRLLDLIHETDEADSFLRVTVGLDGQQRRAMMVTQPSSFAYSLDLPSDAHLTVGINRDVRKGRASDSCFEIRVSSQTASRQVLDACIVGDETGWRDSTIDLSEFGEQQAEIRFTVKSRNIRSQSSRSDIRAFWSDLYIGSASETSSLPNVFVLMVDTLRSDHLGCYGYSRDTSPNIDKLAAQGVRFERMMSTAPWTNPAIFSLFTGLYPSDVWLPLPHREAIRVGLPPEVDTIAEILNTHGYISLAASDHPGINSRTFGQGFDTFTSLFDKHRHAPGWRETSTARVVEQLHELLAPRTASPLFTYIHVLYPHLPNEPPPPYDDFFGPGVFFFNAEKAQYKEEVINAYDGEIRRTDEFIAALLANLEGLGLSENSLFVLLSDHGEGFWEHGYFEHGNTLYNELLNVPLILWSPDRLPSGKTIPDVVQTTDILPTILDFAGISARPTIRGTSLLPVINGQAPSHLHAYSEFAHSRIVEGKAIQSRSFKYIGPNERRQTAQHYDLMEDPAEMNDLGAAGRERAVDLVAAMKEIIGSAEMSRRTVTRPVQEVSEETLQKLKALGYVD